jgi:HAD superfamily hydrolase (TIGR01509 family)
MIKHVIFDLGNVLLNIHSDRAMEAFAKKCDLEVEEVSKFFLSDLHLDFMGGKYTPEELYEKTKLIYKINLSIRDFFDTWNLVIGKPKDGIIPIIEQLSSNFELSICSNTDPIHWKYCLKKYSLLKKFKNYFLSFELKRNKPDPEVFKHILMELKTKGEGCLFIDDSYPNIEAASMFGIHTINGEEPAKIREEMIRMNLLQ